MLTLKFVRSAKLSQNDDLCMLLAQPIYWPHHLRLESFGQTASEAHACGTPVIAFRVGGLPDIIKHKVTGYLADPFDVNSMAVDDEWLLDQKSLESSGHQARIRAISSFSEPVIAEKYKAKYYTSKEDLVLFRNPNFEQVYFLFCYSLLKSLKRMFLLVPVILTGTFLETLSVGMIVPALGILINESFFEQFAALTPILNFFSTIP